jgi:undecaprenyl diphosphate synthase
VRDIAEPRAMTRANDRIDVNICINYGARDEILRATAASPPGRAGELAPDASTRSCSSASC